MKKSTFAITMDGIQSSLQLLLRKRGFKTRGRTFNRVSDDGITHVVNFQMGASDPPGTVHIPGLRENLYGMFAVNLGIYVPEVARFHGGGEAKAWIQEYHCCVRARLGSLMGGDREIWWHLRTDEKVITDVQQNLESVGLPFLERYGTRDKILAEWNSPSVNSAFGGPPRIVSAIILAERGRFNEARDMLQLQVLETRNLGHPAYVKKLAERLGLGDLGS